MAADSQQQLQEQPHPWAALFGDGGIKTALPEGAASSSILTIPPTPAANPNSVPKKAFSGLPSNLPGISASTLSLPAMKGFKLNGGLSSRPTTKSNTASASSSRPTSAEDLSRFKPLQIGQFVEALSNPDWARNAKVAEQHCRPDVLVLDIRPSTSFAAARVCSSINICAPSTLLKRPGVTVERIEQDMLCNNRDRKRFLQWRNGPKKSANTSPDESSPSPKRGATACDAGDFGFKSIIVLDTDTARVSDMGNPTAGGGGPCLIGMLKKFDAAGYAGDLCWLVGGFNKLTSSKEAEALIENKPLSDANHESDDEATDSTGLPGSAAALTPDGRTTSPALAQKLKLPPSGSPFEIGSTSGRKGSLVQPRGLPMEAFQAQSTIAGWPGQAQANRSVNQEQAPAAPQFNLDNRNAGAEQVSSVEFDSSLAQQSDGKLTPPPDPIPRVISQQSACANPFFDNIRQNRELAHGITETIPMELPHMSQPQIEALPPFLQKLVGMSGHERAISLAQSFFDVEKAEQNRLIATMQQHSQQSCEDPRKLASTLAGGQGGVSSFSSVDPAAATKLASSLPALGNSDKGQHFPFSIAAALERGADNRYNNIWTYEHSRVKLSKPKDSQDPGSDYLNGSFVHPMQHYGSKRRYIATQAPLPTTFEAFWTAVWEQNSRVIVMLTREHESGRIQSHPYWNQSEFGPNIRVDKLEEVVMNDDGEIMRGPECDGILRGNANAPELFPSMGSAGGGSASCSTPATIRRLFRLRNLAEPSASPRRIVQLQYIAWPDYHIPDTPDSLLTLMDMADAAQNDADAELRQIATSSGRSSSLSEAYAGPMVVHCSAGVGRTGAFIVIDSTLDVLRRCRRRKRQLAGLSPWDNHGESARSPSHIDVEMPALSPSRTRTPRRSLKRELSPTRMDIDGSSDSQHGRELSSPPPMLRTRSHEGNRDTLDLGSWPSSSSSSVGTPSRAFGSLQIASSASPSFVNPFNSTRTLATPLAAGAGGGGSSGEEASMVTVPGSEHADTVKGPSKLLFGTPTRGSEHYRSGSSPFSEASSLSLPPSSARSSFSAASISEAPHGLL